MEKKKAGYILAAVVVHEVVWTSGWAVKHSH